MKWFLSITGLQSDLNCQDEILKYIHTILHSEEPLNGEIYYLLARVYANQNNIYEAILYINIAQNYHVVDSKVTSINKYSLTNIIQI